MPGAGYFYNGSYNTEKDNFLPQRTHDWFYVSVKKINKISRLYIYKNVSSGENISHSKNN